MITVHLTCKNCGSGINVIPALNATTAKCEICSHDQLVKFDEELMKGNLCDCPECGRKDFYSQKDFNRKIGVALFMIAAILSIWTYGISLIVLYLMDLLLFRKLNYVAICYKCQAIFRGVTNIEEIRPFDHEMNDRIVYSDHDFHGKPLNH
ncbi:MAG: hypothetical protein ACOYL6_09785 [Bacteriovoracaceae bacterium]